MSQATLDYHLKELAIARDPQNSAHSLPPVKSDHRAILDVGCGMGQTLLALNLAPPVEAWGIDLDSEAIEAGRRMAPSNVHLAAGTGEQLAFPNEFFDLVFSRVALPHMRIRRVLEEIHRVLKPGGDLWLSLHSSDKYRSRVVGAVKLVGRGQIQGILYQSFIGLNSILFNGIGKQMKIAGRTETFQTVGGMRRALTRTGFEIVRIERRPFFVVEARKPLARKPL